MTEDDVKTPEAFLILSDRVVKNTLLGDLTSSLSEVQYVIVATVLSKDKKNDRKRVYRLAHKSWNEKWTWSSFEAADKFATKKEALGRVRYLQKRKPTSWCEADIRLLQVTTTSMVEQTDIRLQVTTTSLVEQVYPVPNIVDAVAALASPPSIVAEMIA